MGGWYNNISGKFYSWPISHISIMKKFFCLSRIVFDLFIYLFTISERERERERERKEKREEKSI